MSTCGSCGHDASHHPIRECYKGDCPCKACISTKMVFGTFGELGIFAEPGFVYAPLFPIYKHEIYDVEAKTSMTWNPAGFFFVDNNKKS